MTESRPAPTFRATPDDDPRLDRLLDEIRISHANGGALLGGFEVTSPDPGRPWYSHATPPGWPVELEAFMQSTVLSEAPPALESTGTHVSDPEWVWSGPFTLDGELTQESMQGGAYVRFPGTPETAKRLALDFCDAIFEDRYLDVYCTSRSDRAWSPWFEDVDWDRTWLMYDEVMRRVWLLCLTDTD